MNGVFVRRDFLVSAMAFIGRFDEVMIGPLESLEPGPRRRGRGGGA